MNNITEHENWYPVSYQALHSVWDTCNLIYDLFPKLNWQEIHLVLHVQYIHKLFVGDAWHFKMNKQVEWYKINIKTCQ